MMIQSFEKYQWVDVSKGIVICLMVIGHSSIPIRLSNWIWSFHMPFFFIISAIYTSWDKHLFKQFAIRKAKVLLVPFMIYSILNIMLWPFIIHSEIDEYAVSVLLHGWNGVALWFIPIFYMSLIVCKAIPYGFRLLFGFVMLALGCVLSFEQITLPWTLSSLPFAIFLMTTFSRYQSWIRNVLQVVSVQCMIFVAVLSLILSVLLSQKSRLDMAFNHILPILPILAGIIMGVVFIISISIIISKFRFSKCIQVIGQNTFEIMSLSQVTIAFINHYFVCSIIMKYTIMTLVLIVAVYIRKRIRFHIKNRVCAFL